MIILAWEQSRQIGLTDETHARTRGEEKGVPLLNTAQPASSGANISLGALATRIIVESMFCVCALPN